ncbi:hypothetical protein Ade02nite_69700 [Paractinoplanes deccanensis]|uniref:Integral membrane protein n=1 Tax=Paractinoplanes deccanensis TaxID=113561 RepID=A0ABQ3YEB3_9ACTN|nr:hypothetical protein [Actinoplanes deccanensis]GID78329.1 hypothetical protein Ade02nite_69700 [Actinoplanes deccanensis]
MTIVAAPGISTTASALRRLYFARFAFAIVWAGVMFTTAKHLGPLAVTLLVLYPLVDVAAAVVDARASRAAGRPTLLYVNIVVSLVAAAGLAFAAASGIPAVLRVWGAWAIVAGLVQLVVGVTRRAMGGQWPMIVSGGISVLAGGSFIAGAAADDPALTNAIGYAIPGAIFFLLSAIRLGRTATAARSGGAKSGTTEASSAKTGAAQRRAAQTGEAKTGGARTQGAETGGAKTGGARTQGEKAGGAKTGGVRTQGEETGGARTGGVRKGN